MRSLFFIAVCLTWAQSTFAWGQKGHDIIAYIAEQHLSEQAAEQVDKILMGHSPVYYSSWLDAASHTDEYAYTKTWHYMNVDEDKTFKTMPRNPEGDVQVAVESIVERLKSKTLTPKEEFDELRMLIHLVGDMHCPMHAGRLTDLGGNKVPVTMFGRETNLHSIWDSALVDAARKWSYTEWQNQIDRKSEKEIKQMQEGTPADWMEQTTLLSKKVYDKTPEGANISYDYVTWADPILQEQLLKGGYRLASLLNEIYK